HSQYGTKISVWDPFFLGSSLWRGRRCGNNEGYLSKLAIVIEIQCCRIAPIEDIDLVMIFLVIQGNGMIRRIIREKAKCPVRDRSPISEFQISDELFT